MKPTCGILCWRIHSASKIERIEFPSLDDDGKVGVSIAHWVKIGTGSLMVAVGHDKALRLLSTG